MIDINSAFSGFVGAALGAIIGLLGAFALERRRQDGNDRAAARATLVEIASNCDAMISMGSAGFPTTTTSTTWEAARLRLARKLTTVELVSLAEFYSDVDDLRSSGFPASGKPSETLRGRAGKLRETGQEAAAAVLPYTGWSVADFKHSRLRTLQIAFGMDGESSVAERRDPD